MDGKQERQPVTARVKLTLCTEERFFGPGVCELLEKIRETGSIQAAAARMEMSYTKAWKILKRAEKEMGVAPERVFIAHNGAVIELSARKGVMHETVQAGSLMVDGLKNVEDVVLRDRKTLSVDGLVSAVILIDTETGRLLAPVEIYSRGFIYMRDNEPLIQEASELVYETAKRFEESAKADYPNVKNAVKSRLKSFLYDKTGRTPMILPIVIEI